MVIWFTFIYYILLKVWGNMCTLRKFKSELVTCVWMFTFFFLRPFTLRAKKNCRKVYVEPPRPVTSATPTKQAKKRASRC